MSDLSSIVVIIPVYNEAAMLPAVLANLAYYHFKNVVIVDDCSEEDILSIARRANVHYLRHRTNLGQGAALQTGFEYAKKLNPGVVVTFDADGQHDARDLRALIAPILNNEADIAFGSRFLNSGTKNIPLPRMLVLQCARFVNYLLSGILLTDAHNGLRALSNETVHAVAITENRMAHASEILMLTKQHGLRYKEVGVNIRYTGYSMQKGQTGWDSIHILFDLLLHKLLK